MAVLSIASLSDQAFPASSEPSWIARYDGPSHGEDRPGALAADRLGNTFVTGFSRGESGYDVVTIKYGPAGEALWTERFDGPAGGYDEGTAIALAPDGDVLVAGTSERAGGLDYVLLRYAGSDGALRWVRFYDGAGGECPRRGFDCGRDEASALAVDVRGDAYVTGTSLGLTGDASDYATLAYDRDGNVRWAARTDGAAGRADHPTALVVDPCGQVVVTGRSRGDRQFDVLSVSLAATDGSERWRDRYDGPAGGFDGGVAIGMDAAGALYVVGESYGARWQRGPVVIKYSATGERQWEFRRAAPDGRSQRVIDAAVDPAGNVHVVGTISGTGEAGSRWDIIAMKIGADGAPHWESRHGSERRGDALARDIALDGAGNVFITGPIGVEPTVRCRLCPDFAVWRLDGGTGAATWHALLDGEASHTDVARRVTAAANGTVVVTGMSVGIGPMSAFGERPHDVVTAGYAGVASGGPVRMTGACDG